MGIGVCISDSLSSVLHLIAKRIVVVQWNNSLSSALYIPKVSLFVCIIPNSISDPELISAETLFSSLAKVTFFSSFGSLKVDCTVASPNLVSLNFVWFSCFSCGTIAATMSLLKSFKWISSPRLTFLVFITGDTNCCKICFFSAAFFFVGVELFLFFFGDGVPAKFIDG